MSIKAIDWVFDQKIRPASSKFVLLAIADCVNDVDGCGYPSIGTICHKTSLDRKTVITSLERLQIEGFLRDTGRRVGRTGQIKVLQLLGYMNPGTPCAIPQNGNSGWHRAKALPDPVQEGDLGWGSNDTKNGTLSNGTENGTLGKGAENGTVPVFPAKSPENGTRNRNEPSDNNNNNARGARDADEGYSETAGDILAHAIDDADANSPAKPEKRASKRKSDEPQISFNWETKKFENISDAQMDLWAQAYPAVNVSQEILQAAVWQDAHPENRKSNYKSFFSKWLQRAQNQARPVKPAGNLPPRRGPQPENFGQKDYGKGRLI